jgi:hypothetical protein
MIREVKEGQDEKTISEMSKDEVIISITVTKNMGVDLKAGTVHPRELIKILNNIIVDLQFSVMMPEQQPTQRGLNTGRRL